MKTRIPVMTNSLKISAVGMGCMGFSHGYGAVARTRRIYSFDQTCAPMERA